VAARLSRGDIWTAASGPDYTGKPRPVVILQDDRFDHTLSVTVCPLTTDPTEVPLVRPGVAANAVTGLQEPSNLMVDKISTIPRARIGRRVGRLEPGDITRLNRAILVFLGLAG
jgi:mRNA interferase MazF